IPPLDQVPSYFENGTRKPCGGCELTVGFTGWRACAPLVVFSLALAACATAPSDRQTPAPEPRREVQTVPAATLSLPPVVAARSAPGGADHPVRSSSPARSSSTASAAADAVIATGNALPNEI